MSKETALMDPEILSYRLPRTVVPDKYELRLEPDLINFTFAGEEVVHITVAEPVKQISMNALDLEIFEAYLSNSKGTTLKPEIKLDPENERVHFLLKTPLEAGTWKMQLRFKGVLSEKLHGFYRSTYKDAHGAKKIIATTQFEATDARRAFPCWDEPDFKAVFRVTLIVDQGLTAISNAQVWGERLLPERGKKEVGFKDSMKMSTYLVAFIVGEFDCTEVQVVDGTPVRIICPPGKLGLAKFSQGIAAHALSFFNTYYGLKYPGDKLDLIAIPDFAFGAMENLGAVTFRETALLVDEKTASHAELERVADVVAHEIAHMWFGDLATMSWWNGIWLNEAFATFMQMLAVDAWKPHWKRWETFGLSRASAFSVDGLKATRPIEFPVRHPGEAQAMFDVLTYEKGASVLRMLEQYLGAEQFRRGIILYLSKHKYSNCETTDLWDAIEESCKQPVRQLMDSWIYQEGHPLITVTVGATKNEIKLEQQRFLYSQDGDKSTLFHVPIMLRAKVGDQVVYKKLLLTDSSTSVEFEAKPDWVVVNEGAHGFYRVSYAPELMQSLKINLSTLAPIERFNLVNDAWAAVLAGLKPLSEFVELAKLFTQETDKNVWFVLLGAMQYIERVLGPADGGKRVPDQLGQFVRTVAAPAQQRLGWEPQANDDELTKQLRGMLVGTLGTIGDDADVRARAAELYEKYKNDRGSISPDLAAPILTILAQTGDERRFNVFLKEYKEASTPQEEDRYLFSLAAFRDLQLLTRTLEKTTNGEVRTQSGPNLMRTVMLNTAGRELAWQFVKQNWPTLLKTFDNTSITRMLEGITALVTEELLNETREFFVRNEPKQGKKLIDQHLEKQAVAVAFRQREKATLNTL
ncbi:MAG TPA: M1 family metallopeptidase [Trichormus sp.]